MMTECMSLEACVQLRDKIEISEDCKFSLRGELMRAQEDCLAAKIDHRCKGKGNEKTRIYDATMQGETCTFTMHEITVRTGDNVHGQCRGNDVDAAIRYRGRVKNYC
jgi:hypothetical protein